MQSVPDSGSSVSSVQALARGLDILLAFSNGSNDLGITELAQITGLSKPTTYRLVNTMLQKGFLVSANRRYRLGPQFLRMAAAHLGADDIRATSLPHLEQLRNATEETASVVVRSGSERICVAFMESRHELRRSVTLGETRPLTEGTSGHVLLAWLDELVIRRMFVNFPPRRAPEIDAIDLELYVAHLRVIRERGYDTVLHDQERGLFGIAAPVRDAEGTVIAALNLAGPLSRMDDNRFHQLLSSVLSTALAISTGLGWSPNAVRNASAGRAARQSSKTA